MGEPEKPFAERAKFVTMSLVDVKMALLAPASRPLTLVYDGQEFGCSKGPGLLVFRVVHKLRGTKLSGEDVWKLTCDFNFVYHYVGTPPTQEDAVTLSPSVLRLAYDNLRETAHYFTQLSGLPPLVIDMAKFPDPK